MKRILIVLLVFLTFVVDAQTTLLFKLNAAGQPVIDGLAPNSLSLPLTLNFPATFANKSIAFKDAGHNAILSFSGAAFGDSNNPALGDGTYQIVLNTDGTFSNATATNNLFALKKDFILVIAGTQVGDVFKMPPTKTARLTLDKTYNTGYAYYDAVELQSDIDNGDAERVVAILKNYNIKNATDLGNNVILNTLFAKYYNTQGATIQGTFDFGSVTQSSGNLDVTSLADGLAQFLVQRTREELNAAFFQKFKEAMNRYPELTTMFPQTTAFIGGMASYKMSEILEDLRDAFTKDLNAITQHFLEFAQKDGGACPVTDQHCIDRMNAYKSFFKSDPGLALLIAVDFADGVRAGKNMHDLVERLGNSSYAEEFSNDNIRNVYLFAGVISNSLLSKDSTRVWIKYKQLSDMASDPVLLPIYTGLVYQQLMNEEVTTIGGVTLDNVFQPLNGAMAPMVNFLTAINKTADILTNINLKPANGKISFTDYYKFTKGALGVLSEISKLDELCPACAATYNKPQFDQFLDVANVSTDLVYNMDQKKYGLAVNNIITLINDIVITIPTVKPSQDSAIRTFQKYAGFIAKVANLTTAKDVKDAIAQVALPVGSSALKKNTIFSISLNCYVAPFVGDEIYNGSNTLATGLYAPVGFGFNWGIWENKSKQKEGQKLDSPKSGGHPSSFSIYVPLIDVGAVVAYRFGNSTTTTSESAKIRLGDIFSPGVNLFYGIPCVPLSIGVGGNWLPTLAKFYADQAPDLRPNGWRVFGTIALDIPVFHFYNKEHSKP